MLRRPIIGNLAPATICPALGHIRGLRRRSPTDRQLPAAAYFAQLHKTPPRTQTECQWRHHKRRPTSKQRWHLPLNERRDSQGNTRRRDRNFGGYSKWGDSVQNRGELPTPQWPVSASLLGDFGVSSQQHTWGGAVAFALVSSISCTRPLLQAGPR